MDTILKVVMLICLISLALFIVMILAICAAAAFMDSIGDDDRWKI